MYYILSFSTLASGLGGGLVGLSYYIVGVLYRWTHLRGHGPVYVHTQGTDQWPMLIFGLIFGVLGSLIDSLLGATLQATYYDNDRKCIVKKGHSSEAHVERVAGLDILSNEAVNFVSIAVSMILAIPLGPLIFKSCFYIANKTL